MLDRLTGKLLSANNFVPATWARRIDLATGKPDIDPAAHYGMDPVVITPGPGGGHNWFPMAYTPEDSPGLLPGLRAVVCVCARRELHTPAFSLQQRVGAGSPVRRWKRERRCRSRSIHARRPALLAWGPGTAKGGVAGPSAAPWQRRSARNGRQSRRRGYDEANSRRSIAQRMASSCGRCRCRQPR